MEYREIYFSELESTNLEARDAGYGDGVLLVAGFQSGGRGQMGSVWESAADENLLMSLVVERRDVRVCEQFYISEVLCVSLCRVFGEIFGRFLGENGGEKALVKWPNDIVIQSDGGAMVRKIAGVLIEHSFSSEWLSRSVLGCGVNLLQTQWSGEGGFAWSVTSLAREGISEVSPADFLEIFKRIFSEVSAIDRTALHAEYMGLLWRKSDGSNTHWRFADQLRGAEEFWGRIGSVCPHSGQLFVEILGEKNEVTETRTFLFKEVKHLP